ncbi:MAG: hypothetical protein EAZ40_17925 [Rhodobacterales bacterium]|nr:MAG: hypothetical protein EAZ40_17925 [Rhodobacterales bacterium]
MLDTHAAQPKLKSKDAPDLGRFDWEDPFRLNDQLTEEERMLRDGARAYATEKLQPRVIAAYREETTDPSIFREMGEMGLLGVTVPEEYGGLGLDFGYNAIVDEESSYYGRVATGFSLQFIFGMIGAPVAWLIGIDADNLLAGGRLLGEKVVLNEFFAYFTLSGMQASGELVDDRARIILTYALCGFSNIVSIGIQVGGLGAMAPGRRGDIAMLGWRALLGGNIACFFTACIVGMLI